MTRPARRERGWPGAMLLSAGLHLLVLACLVMLTTTERPAVGADPGIARVSIAMISATAVARPQPRTEPVAVVAPAVIVKPAPLLASAQAAPAFRARSAAPVAVAAAPAEVASRPAERASPAVAAVADSAGVPADQAEPRSARPDYAYNPAPEYPLLLREQGVEGVVWIRVRVEIDGQPSDVLLVRGSGYRLLDASALSAVRRWRFIPARRGEQLLSSWAEFPVRFSLQG